MKFTILAMRTGGCEASLSSSRHARRGRVLALVGEVDVVPAARMGATHAPQSRLLFQEKPHDGIVFDALDVRGVSELLLYLVWDWQPSVGQVVVRPVLRVGSVHFFGDELDEVQQRRVCVLLCDSCGFRFLLGLLLLEARPLFLGFPAENSHDCPLSILSRYRNAFECREPSHTSKANDIITFLKNKAIDLIYCHNTACSTLRLWHVVIKFE
jgi:hypothetical protein